MRLVTGFLLGILGLITIGIIFPLSGPYQPPIHSYKQVKEACSLNICKIYLPNKMMNSYNWDMLANRLLTSSAAREINIYIGGMGGYSHLMKKMITAVKYSPAKINMIVIADVSSAHAYLAISGDTLKTEDWHNFMFHSSSFLNEEKRVCKASKGLTDRGQDAYKKCIENTKKRNKLDEIFMLELLEPILTAKERERVLTGYEVIISGKDLKKRLANASL